MSQLSFSDRNSSSVGYVESISGMARVWAVWLILPSTVSTISINGRGQGEIAFSIPKFSVGVGCGNAKLIHALANV